MDDAVTDNQLGVLADVCQGPIAFPVVYEEDNQGDLRGSHNPINWKLLSQLRSTVNESGLQSEPTKQLLKTAVKLHIGGGLCYAQKTLK